MEVVLALLLLCVVPCVSPGYSVLTHEAIIDSMWERDIVPVLRQRFPRTSADELREAHGYAYGGSIIQDMGYYPFGSKTYSDLTHYVRSGEFIETLLREAKDVNEYAFAVGALSHYWADYGGHTIATNISVPILYPKLQRKFGNTVTYEQDRSAHIRTELGFDVLQVAQGHYARTAYHDFIGFRVSKELLQRAFQETYGIELKSLFTDLDFAIGTYRHTVSTLIPKITKIAWESSKGDMAERGMAQRATVAKDSAAIQSPNSAPTTTRDQFLFTLSRAEYNKEWGNQYREPGFFTKFLSFLLRIVPKIGPFKNLDVKPSTPETEQLFMRGFLVTTASYRTSLAALRTNTLNLENLNFDTGKPVHPHEYKLADIAHARLLHELAGNKFEHMTPALRANITTFYRDTSMRVGTRRDSTAWKSTLAELKGLREAVVSRR